MRRKRNINGPDYEDALCTVCHRPFRRKIGRNARCCGRAVCVMLVNKDKREAPATYDKIKSIAPKRYADLKYHGRAE